MAELVVVTHDQVVSDKEILIPLKRSLRDENGVLHQSISLRYPTIKDLNKMKAGKKKSKLDEDGATEVLISLICVRPKLTPEVMDNIAVSDFVSIQDELQKSGYLGLTSSKEDEKDEDGWKNAELFEVEDNETITVKLVFPIQAIDKNGEVNEFDKVTLRYPLRKDIKRINKERQRKKLEEDDLKQLMLSQLATEPLLSLEDIENLSQSDYFIIQRALDVSGFFGIIPIERRT